MVIYLLPIIVVKPKTTTFLNCCKGFFSLKKKLDKYIKEARTNINGKEWKMAVRIGKTAAKLFNKRGYLETNMNDIAAKAKMSKGSVYHYFPSKDEILYFILSNYMDLILTDLEHKVMLPLVSREIL